ncbi:MAG: SPOR domain-containing protein, partial [Hyphomicrobiales bacterium]
NDYFIIDEDISKNFYFEQASVDLTTEVNNLNVAELDDPLIVTDDVSLIPNESIDLEQLLRNSEIFNYNEPNEDIALAMAPVESENNEAEISEVDTVSVLEEDFIYPISKPTKLIEPITKSDIIDEFVTATTTDIVEFKKVYYGVQVSSVETRLEATNIYETLLTQYSSVLNRSNQSHKNLIKQDDLGSMGIWYKLRIGPFDDRSTAKKLCSSLRDEGLPGCIVVELE